MHLFTSLGRVFVFKSLKSCAFIGMGFYLDICICPGYQYVIKTRICSLIVYKSVFIICSL